MSRTDTSERGLESLIYSAMTGYREPPARGDAVAEPTCEYGAGTGWRPGDSHDYDREYTVDLARLREFLNATQADAADSLDLDGDSPVRRKFPARLQGEISKRGRRGYRMSPAAGLGSLYRSYLGSADPRLPYAARRRAEIAPLEFLHASTPDLPALKEPHPKMSCRFTV